MNPFLAFMVSPHGRMTRRIVGVVVFVGGIWGLGGAFGIVLGVVGAVLILAAVFDLCLLGPLFGAPVFGRDIRGE
jgi:hypothetical protein